MAQSGRRSGGAGAVAVVAVWLMIWLELGDAAATFMVGDSNGWNFNVKGWPNGKVFRAGDVLRFKYDPRVHNVVAVDEEGYNSCTAPTGTKVLSSGNDEIKLSPGHNFFICTTPGHCQAGMKIATTAL
ncbi:basic blue protein-like [Momordica charantia]|uniref:Basic blue protein n=1 Tax=Momordica charantia TaxID=3673 RepID=A0A6J1DI73_MOMCH|nr:basic blue protein-like [Momordica charantia]